MKILFYDVYGYKVGRQILYPKNIEAYKKETNQFVIIIDKTKKHIIETCYPDSQIVFYYDKKDLTIFIKYWGELLADQQECQYIFAGNK